MNEKLSLTAIVLAYNEEQHLQRCIDSLKDVCSDIVIIDSFSTDKTLEIAVKNGARFYQNKFINHASQLNWGLLNGEITTDWIFRVDADEYLSTKLGQYLIDNLSHVGSSVNGIMVNRLMFFFNKPLKMGGMYPIKHLRIWRKGTAICEKRWMDERMRLNSGEVVTFEGDLIDHNLNKLTWWIQKHNSYATKEAIDILDKRYNFSDSNVLVGRFFGDVEERRRWLKIKYLQLPLFIRPFLFWFIRYFLQGGFLEGTRGFIWNILQCWWYRFLVDAKIYEAHKAAGKNKMKLIQYFKEEYGYDVTKVG